MQWQLVVATRRGNSSWPVASHSRHCTSGPQSANGPEGHHRLSLCGVTAVYAIFVVAGIFVAPVLYYAALSPVNDILGMR